jgi:uncharacterized membrane protein YcaP (DUF421 family)
MSMFAEADFEPFDFYRIFLGDKSWVYTLEIVFRTTVMYLYALLLLRLLGKRGIGEFTPFDHVIVVAMGASIGDPMYMPDVPLLHGMIVLTMVVLFQRFILRLEDRYPRLEHLLEGEPRRVVDNGVLDLRGLIREDFSREDLFQALREAGVEHLGQVKWAFLEPSGRVSVGQFPPDQVRPGLLVLPPYDDCVPEGMQVTEPPIERSRLVCWNCGQVVEVAAAERLNPCSRCGRDQWLTAHGGPTTQE